MVLHGQCAVPARFFEGRDILQLELEFEVTQREDADFALVFYYAHIYLSFAAIIPVLVVDGYS